MGLTITQEYNVVEVLISIAGAGILTTEEFALNLAILSIVSRQTFQLHFTRIKGILFDVTIHTTQFITQMIVVTCLLGNQQIEIHLCVLRQIGYTNLDRLRSDFRNTYEIVTTSAILLGKVLPIAVSGLLLVLDFIPLTPYDKIIIYAINMHAEFEVTTRLTHVDRQDVEIILRNNQFDECTIHKFLGIVITFTKHRVHQIASLCGNFIPVTIIHADRISRS